ncbi:uncharacterized protein LOC107044415 [Diachasma alloeum]|uniref:uncharacterized protein LOC107044415 n=1 Tax=Diachasma alloeum TaxID=454923 RepID=UPI0007382032|nr:uncharacterized protein LOC107044415 [Diachasma alloeum]
MAEEEENVITPPSKKAKPLPKKVKIPQKFREAWLNMPEFQSWLQKHSSGEFKAKCRLCSKELTADISVLKYHLQSSKHKDNCNSIKSINPMTSFFTRGHDIPSQLDEAVKVAETGLVGYPTEHHMPFSALDHLTDLMKNLITDSKIVQNMNLKRTKGRAIALNVISVSAKNKLGDKLKATKFSVLSDESTDISTKKCSCIMVRFYDDETGRIATKFWSICDVLVPGKVTSVSAERLYECSMLSFVEQQIPKANIIGFGSDGCSVMMGKNNSVASRLKTDLPGITISKCLCHSLHICASTVCEELPRTAENLARNINYYFTSSCKRQSEFGEFQIFCETEIHKLLYPSQTRWLSLVAVVQRLLDQWPALQL